MLSVIYQINRINGAVAVCKKSILISTCPSYLFSSRRKKLRLSNNHQINIQLVIKKLQALKFVL